MGMILNNGAFFMGCMDEIRDAIQEAEEGLETLLNKLLGFGTPEYMDLADLAVAGYCPSLEEIERAGWRSAAAFARSKMASRVQAFARQMEHQKARQAMKRRKLMHSESSFPDLRACATCRHHRPIGAPIPSACCGCIQGGECTKWEHDGGKEND